MNGMEETTAALVLMVLLSGGSYLLADRLPRIALALFLGAFAILGVLMSVRLA